MPEETCFRCSQPDRKISAYITKSLMPVCEDCLNLLIEKYWWDENSVRIKKSRGLSPYTIKSKDEIAEELDRYLSRLPLFRERTVTLDRLVANRLVKMPEFRSIRLMREF